MKLLRFLADGEAHVGVKLPDGILDLTASGYANSFEETIRVFTEVKPEIEALCGGDHKPLLDEGGISYLPPASHTSKVICVGLNYKLHIEEANKSLTPEYPSTPILFAKFNNSLSAHMDEVKLSSGAVRYDYEAELVVVMGKGGMDIPKEKAAAYIFGYTCGNDISARDAQQLSSQWLIGKSFPGFAPAGPWVVTGDELDPSHLAITCSRGAQVVQSSNTDQMLFDVATIVSFASKYIRLEPGDLIFTGTPSGVILGLEPERQQWLKAGDEIRVSIEHIGDLVTRFS